MALHAALYRSIVSRSDGAWSGCGGSVTVSVRCMGIIQTIGVLVSSRKEATVRLPALKDGVSAP